MKLTKNNVPRPTDSGLKPETRESKGAASLSLVMCTRNRAVALGESLSAISMIEPPTDADFEFILIDNGSTDQTPDIFERHKSSMRFPARRIFEPAPGVGNGLNCGYQNSHGAIVAFTDDDCYPASDFASAVLSSFDDPSIGVVTGRILLHDPNDLPLTIKDSIVPQRFKAGDYVWPGQFTGANLSFRRKSLDAIGGFDPLFGPGSYIGSGADCDAAARVCLAGWDGQYDPEILVYHHHCRKDVDADDIQRRYAIGSGGYHMKLLIEQRRIRHFLRYLRRLPKKLMLRPSTLYWEAIGAARFLNRPRRLTEPQVDVASRRLTAGE